MVITGKIKYLEQSHKDGWITVVLSKTRKGKPIEIPIFFQNKYRQEVSDQTLRIGLNIDVKCFVYGKKTVFWWNTYLVAEYYRVHKKGQRNIREVANTKTGEVINLKNDFQPTYKKNNENKKHDDRLSQVKF